MRLFLFFIIMLLISCETKKSNKKNFGYRLYLKTGDILFRESSNLRYSIFTRINNSVINDCGVVEIDDENVYVWSMNIRLTKEPIDIWLKRGKTIYFLANRMADHNSLIHTKFKLSIIKFMGRTEDFKFKWGTKALYNAEFIRKLYSKMIGMEVTTLENQYIYNNGKSKQEFVNLVTPFQLYSSEFFVEVFSSFPVISNSDTSVSADIESNE